LTSTKGFTRFATLVAHATGKPVTFALCVIAIVVWALCGPIFHFSDTWQLVINTSTTIITFLQVFLIQNTQNRDGAAIQAKLDELIRASAAHNRFIGIEDLTEEELVMLRERAGGKKADRIESALDAADEAEDDANQKAAQAARSRGGSAL
jgi:low affinity Fe/Cu permease